MAKYTNLNNLFTDMANAIRAKTGSTATIIADNFPTEIENLKTGFDYNNTDVTVIPDYAFYGCEDINSVDCYNLTSVGTSAFENCTNLRTVVLYDNLESVGENSFKGCNCTIYCYFDSIPDTWHENWNPDSCEVIFVTPVETWDISATEDDDVVAKLYSDINNKNKYRLVVKGIGSMNNYTLGTVPWYSYRNNIKFVTILDGVTSIGKSAFYECSSTLTSITIPDSVTTIGEYAFYECTSLTSVTIPDSVTTIGDWAFTYCSGLTSINIPDSVPTIGTYAFSSCRSLTSITIPNSVTTIGDNAFRSCNSLTSITIPDSVTTIGEMAFQNCRSLTSITIPDSVTTIGQYVLYNCSGLKTAGPIGGGYNCEFGWTEVIPANAFSYCTSLTSITIPDSVISIGDWAFQYCSSLTSIAIPDSVTTFGESAFRNCTSLESIIIPDSVTSVGERAFQNCTSLQNVTYTGTTAQWNAITKGTEWNNDTGNYTIHCTDGDITKDGY